MKATLTRMFCRFLAIAIMVMPFQSGQAAMIGTDQVSSATVAQAERAAVVNYLTRSQTVSQFQTMGVDAQTAIDRVAAMTDAEVSTLADTINSAPAGGDGTSIAVILLVGFLIWYFAFRR